MEKLLLLMCLVACTRAVTLPYSGQGSNGAMECSNHFILHGNFCYRYFGSGIRKAYHAAQKLCTRHQSSLVSLHSSGEEAFVVALAVNRSGEAGFWIGLNDEDGPGQAHREGYFKWSLGEEAVSSYCHWKPGEPNNKRHLDCVKVEVQGWAMAPGGCATAKLPFVCKRRACLVGETWDGTGCVLEQSRMVTTGYVLLLLLLCSCIVMATLLICTTGDTEYRTKPRPQELFPT